MDKAQLWDCANGRHGNGGSSLYRAGHMVESLVRQIRGVRTESVVTSTMPLNTNLSGNQSVGLLRVCSLDAAKDVERPMRQHFTQAPGVHAARDGKSLLRGGPVFGLLPGQTGLVRNQRGCCIHAHSVLADRRKGGPRMSEQPERIVTDYRPRSQQDHGDALQGDVVISARQGIRSRLLTPQKRQSAVASR